ncbi:hypothetical protein Roomu2_00132 [Pseudomonas phage vB_PpuM-Roomu-2]|uniref:Uncharacterized protein n=2 Tax=Tartuvirus TaxID=3424912 RepID=A0AAX4MZ07_9CAUD
MNIWEHLRDLIVFLLIVALLAWVILKPKHKEEDYDTGCKNIGGVVAYTVLKSERVCVKEKK